MRVKRLVTMVAVGMALAACGSGGTDGTGAAQPAPGAPTGAVRAGTTLTYWASNQGTSLAADKKILTPQLERFTQQTGVQVDVEVVPWSDLLNRILAATTSGKGPDVLNIGNTWSASLQATGGLMPFDDTALTALGGRERFLAGSLSATGAADQPPAAVPLYSLAYGLYYNKAHFEEAGITAPPRTWEEFVAAGKKLTAGGRWGLTMEGGSGTENVHNVFTLSKQRGGDFFDPAGQPTFNTPANVAAVKQYVDLMQTDKIVNPSNAEYSNGTTALQDFAKGRSSMLFWQAAQGSLTELGMDPADIGVAPLPVPSQPVGTGQPVTSMVAGINLAVFNDTEHKAEALEFVKFMTSVETQKSLNKTYGSLPSVTDAYDDPAFQTENVQVFRSILETSAAPLPAVAEESQFETLVGTTVKNLLADAAGGKTVTEQQIAERLAADQQQLGG